MWAGDCCSQMLELSDKKVKITMISILRILMGKADNMQDNMVNVNRRMETKRNNKK